LAGAAAFGAGLAGFAGAAAAFGAGFLATGLASGFLAGFAGAAGFLAAFTGAGAGFLAGAGFALDVGLVTFDLAAEAAFLVDMDR
jgi:hypothetical protein